MKKNKSVLIASIMGIVACLVCVGVIYLFPKSENNLKGNEIAPIEEENINLGDNCTRPSSTFYEDCSSYTSQNCDSINESGICYHNEGSADSSECGPDDGISCCKWKRVDISCPSTPKTCGPGEYVDGSSCEPCPKGTAKSGTNAATSCTSCTGNTYASSTGSYNCTSAPYNSSVNDDKTGWSCNTGYHTSADGKSCVADSTPTKDCYKVNNSSKKCEKVTVEGTSCTSSSYTYYADESTCRTHIKCPAGYGTTSSTSGCVICAAGTFSATDDYKCNACTESNQWSAAGASQCETCSYGNASPSHTGCADAPPTASGCSAGWWRGQNNCERCPVGYKCSDTIKKEACDGEYEYQDEEEQTSCKFCESGKKPNSTHTACVAIPSGGCNAGQYVNDNGSCSDCEEGYYCNGTNKFACPAGKTSPARSQTAYYCSYCDVGYISSAGGTCRECTATNTTSNGDHTACVCKSGYIIRGAVCTEIDSSQCDVSATTVSKHTSIDKDPIDNSYYVVSVTATGKFCTGQTITYTTNNGKVNKTSDVITSNSETSTYTFIVYPSKPCDPSHGTATLTNGKQDDSENVTILYDWHYIEDQCEKEPKYTSFEAADAEGEDVYYTDYGKCKNSEESGYRIKWYRYGCGSGGGSTPAPTTTPVPTATPVPTINRCYIDSDNNYHWTSNPESSWKIAVDDDGNEITNKNLCPPKDACYEDENGEYTWGEYSAKPGYTYHAELTSEDMCEKDDAYKCYKMDTDYSCFFDGYQYAFAKEAPAGYTKIEDITKCGDEYIWSKSGKDGYTETKLSYKECENPACYYYEKNKTRVWGKYSKVNGYFMLVDEDDKPLPMNQCKNYMCYEDSNGDYIWGDYEGEEDYTPLPNITDISECGPEVPTPKTDINVSRVVYVFMAILMAAGIGFIYYSTIMKKDN